MMKEEWLVSGARYNCYVNDIVTGWIEELMWLNGEWVMPDGSEFPCIVDYAIHQIQDN